MNPSAYDAFLAAQVEAHVTGPDDEDEEAFQYDPTDYVDQSERDL